MIDLPKVFLDTSIIIAAMRSENAESPNLVFFKLGQFKHVDLRVSRGVLQEAEGVLRALGTERFNERKARLAEMLDLANVDIAGEPGDEIVDQCVRITKYRPDAKVLASAIEIDSDVLVTYDKAHLLNNPEIGPPNTKLVVMNTSEALDWLQDRILTRMREGKKRQ